MNSVERVKAICIVSDKTAIFTHELHTDCTQKIRPHF